MKTSKIIFVLAFIAASAFNAAEAFKFKDEVQKQEAAQNPKVEKIEEEIVDDSAVNFGEEAEDEKNREARKIEEPQIKLVQEAETEGEKAPLEKNDEIVSEDQAEGRFFLKKKLCALGLADCHEKVGHHHHGGGGIHHGNIEYVQPVKVVPHGPPVPAIPIKGGPRPAYSAPSNAGGYGAPSKPSYNAPSTGYGPPNKPSYKAPSTGYGPPAKPSYNAPSGGYGPPVKPSYNAPSSGYGAPSKPSYNAPSGGYGAPSKPSYNAPSSGYGAPSKPTYNAPKPSYSSPTSSYGAPTLTSSYGGSRLDVSSSQNTGLLATVGSHQHVHHHHSHPFQTNFDSVKRDIGVGGHGQNHHHGHGHNDHHSHGHNDHHSHGHGHHDHHSGHGHSGNIDLSHGANNNNNRQGRKDECYCVPAAQCPKKSVMNKGGASFQDYSGLINPRIKPSDIVAGDEEVDSLDLSENNRARSLNLDEEVLEQGQEEKPKKAVMSEGDDAVILPEKSKPIKGTIESRRKRRDLTELEEEEEVEGEVEKKQEEQYTDAEGRRLKNRFVSPLLGKMKKDKEITKARKTCPEYGCDDDDDDDKDLDEDFVDVDKEEEEEVNENSRLDLEGVADSVSQVGSSVQSGVDRFLGNIGSLLGIDLPEGSLQPTVGVSFGLPQKSSSYGGYAQNPVGTGGAVNPYYNSPDGIAVGAVDVNPLLSFQTTTNDEGEVVAKPLVNLHVVPNGCGIFGCDYDEQFHSNRKQGSSNGFLDVLFPKPNYQSQYHHQQQQHHHPQPNYTPDYHYPQQDHYQQHHPQESVLPNPPRSESFFPSAAIVKHEHHHYHHQPQQQHQSRPQQGGNGFSFGYNDVYGRNVEANELKKRKAVFEGEEEKNLDEEQQQVVIGSSHAVPIEHVRGDQQQPKKEKNAFKFPEGRSLESRKKRSPEGGHHHGDHHHGHDDHHHGQSVSAAPLHDLRQFGPSGYRPPTCGGSGSGYVCCKVGTDHFGQTVFVPHDEKDLDNGAHNHHNRQVNNNEGGFNSVSNFNGGLGQCGVRNSHGIVGRIAAAGKFGSESEGETEFDDRLDSALLEEFDSDYFHDNDEAEGSRLRRVNHYPTEEDYNDLLNLSNATAQRLPLTTDSADFAEYPWQVAILKKEEFDNVYLCGGSLIDGSHILTAAHCIKDYKPEELRIRVGEWDVNNDSEFYTHVEYDARNVFVHDQFYPGNLYNDIALIRLAGYVDYATNPHISPVCLPDRRDDFAGRRCFVTGWGKDAFVEGNYQHTLKEVEVPVLSNSLCERMLKRTKLGQAFKLHEGFVCAGGEEGKDACKGDGGGPLVCEVGGVWQLAGIVSWGVGCGEYNVPGVYVKVSHYQKWIQEQLLRRA